MPSPLLENENFKQLRFSFFYVKSERGKRKGERILKRKACASEQNTKLALVFYRERSQVSSARSAVKGENVNVGTRHAVSARIVPASRGTSEAEGVWLTCKV